MNEKFVAVSTVTGSRIHGCSSKPSVSRGGGNRRKMQLDGLSNLRKKNRGKVCRAESE